MTQTLEKFPIGQKVFTGEHATESQSDRLSHVAAGLLIGRPMASTAIAGLAIEIAPHTGYQQYFNEREANQRTLNLLRDESLEAANFPSVRYARGWMHAETAMSTKPMPFDERVQAVKDAAENWQIARDLIPKMYETYPGHFLIWPGSKWRYQLAIDSLPTILAIADQRDSGMREFDSTLIEQSQANIRDTLGILQRIYEWTERQEQLPDANILALNGRKGVIIGLELEGAGAYLVQLAAGSKRAVTAPSLQLDFAGASGADLAAYTPGAWIHTSQIKKNVRARDQKRYTNTTLLCGTHHLSFPGEPVINTVRAIADGTRQDELRERAQIALEVVNGSREHGCSSSHRPDNPYFYRTAA